MPFDRATRRITVTDNYELDQIARYLGDPLDNLLAQPIVNGRLITGLSLTAGENAVEHQLERELLGYIVVRKSAAADINDGTPTDLPSRFVNLQSSADTVVSLWVF